MSDALQSKLNKLSQTEQAMLRLISDPVLWVEATLRNPEPGKGDEPIKLRPYQANILRHPSKRRVCRMGRRTGKCVSGDALIGTTQGRLRAEDLCLMENKPSILTFDETDLKVKETDKYLIWPNGVKPVYRLTTRLGRQTKVTGNHPFCIIGEDGLPDWKDLDDLQPGDRVAVPSTYHDLIQGQPIDRNLARLLGYLVGDGGTSTRCINFTNIDDSIINDIGLILADYDCQLRPRGEKKGNYTITGIIPFKRGQHTVRNLCKEHDLAGKLAIEKRIPELIMNADKDGISEFIGAYWDCDGWVSVSKNGNLEIGASTASEGLAHDLQHLLLRLGINASLHHKPVKYNGGVNDNWVVIICHRLDMIQFLNCVKMVLKDARKEEILALIEPRRNTFNSVQSTVPNNIVGYLDLIKGNISDREIERSVGTRIRRAYSPTKDKLAKYADLFDDDYLRNLCNSDVIWDEIVSIEYVGEEETYDLSVCETHTLIADDIISHNTSSMVMHIIWYAYTHRDSKQIIATPYQSQIDLIFDMIRQYIKSAPGLSSSIVRDIKNPSKIELSNGAIIRGFTAGTKNGDSGASLRGQAADWIYLDECVTGDTHVLTPDGEKFISDLKAGDMVLSYAQDGSLVERKILKMKCTGTKPVLRLHTSGDKVLICTANHPLLTSCGYQQAGLAKDVLTIDGLEYVLSISQESNQPVYNLTVEGEHNYIANGLITHNCDYMNDSDIETISAIALDRPSIGIWASSTPSGRRGMFWKMCTGVIKKKIRDAVGKIIGEESAWHEFYHPSTENPNWNEDMEAEFRAMFTEVAYEHEVLAEFGEETIGVFKKILIDAARAEYTYDQARLSPKMGPRIMGVDWDKYADASQAVILEYNQSAKQFMVIHRHETPKSAFTLTNAVSRIIELNEEYRLDYIFVDRGYGEYQVETLHKYGIDNPASGLHHKVRGVAFSEFKDIIDPHTKEIRSEPLKPFMVNTLLNILEGYKLKISEYDEMIIRQMENYQVIKKTISGQPVYTSSDEHSLDCLMLCCLGFVEKYPEIIDDIFITRYANAIGRLSSDKDKEEKHPVQQAIDKIADEALAAIDVGKKPSVHKFNTRGTPRFRRTSF